VDQELDLWGDPIPPRQETRGRPNHVPTDEKRTRIKVLRALNKTDAEIAAAMGISQPTLRKYYFRELKGGLAQLRAAALVKLWEKAAEGNVAALKAFIAETRHADIDNPQHPPQLRPRREPPLGKKQQADLDAAEPDPTNTIGAILAEREGHRLN
jgi:transcriptional regulator with XRE-family HTH domain